MLDATNKMLHVFLTAPDSGCPFTGTPGTIFEKTSPMDKISFPLGRGTPVIRDAATPNLNNPTSTKQSVTSATGLVVLASSDSTSGNYWHAYQPIVGSAPAPLADFTASPTSGAAPLNVSFTDTSTGTPTGWAWDFGDGSTSTTQSPTHTYSGAGTYTVSLTARNANGSDTKTRQDLISVAAHNPVIAAAGDIACPPGSSVTPTTCQQEATSNLLVAGGYDGVLPLGDNQYNNGELVNYQQVFDPTWGRVRQVVHPTPGNHEYQTPGATGYFSYFGAAAGPDGRGYYSFDLGSWHLISLDSEIPMGVGSPQETWLRNDLAANAGNCVLAYWHQPLYTSDSVYGPGIAAVRPLYDELYYAGADVVLNGHAHDYERFAPQNPYGSADADHGLREFVVGTGGAEQRPLGTRLPNSVVFNSGSFGLLTMTLQQGAYSWAFIPTAGGTLKDSGVGTCSTTKPSPPSAPVADFTAATTSGQLPLSVPFNDASTGRPSTWFWSFGDGTTSTLQNPTHVYSSAGTHTVSLTVSNVSGSDTQTRVGYITVNPAAPIADFGGSPTGGSAPLRVSFSDNSTNNPTAWSWDFGDGGTSAAQDPTYTYTTSGTYTVKLTASNNGGSGSKTRVDYVTVTPSVASYQAEVLADSPVSYWRLGEATGTTAADSAGSSTGSIKGGIVTGAPGALAGDANTAMSFDGTTGYVSVPNSSSLNLTGDLSIELWAKPGALDNTTRAAVHKGGASGYPSYQYRLGLTSSNFWRGTVFIGSDNYTVTSPSIAKANTWTFLAMTRRGSTLTLYMNGVAVATTTASASPLNTSTGVLAVGRTGSTSVDYFKGSLDEVAVYPAALSPARITAHYRAGTPG
jgi:PKD repeat protein